METKIIKSDRKSISIRIEPNVIIVRAPKYYSNDDISNFINNKKPWIDKKLKELEKYKLNDLQLLSDDEIVNLKRLAKDYFPERVKYYADILNVSYEKITIRSQKTRWGSCSSKGNLNFNCLLMLFPKEVIDSVIVHELCHRKFMNHSKSFYNEVLKAFPQYKECHNWLKENGKNYIMRIRK